MSELVDKAVSELSAKLQGKLDGSAKFVILEEGCIMLDETGVRAGDDPADVVLTADTETFRAILEGRLSAMSAYMSGKLAVEGNMGTAMKLGMVLS